MPSILDVSSAQRPVLATETVDLRDPGWLTQPRRMAAQLRPRGRVHRDTQGQWLLSDHADCRAAMQSSRLSRDPRRSRTYATTRPFIAGSALEQAAERFMLFNDAPVHTRLRRVVAAAFTPPAIRQLRQGIADSCEALLRALPDDEPFDFMRGFAQTLPIRVICDLLGIDPGDHDLAKAWSDAASCLVEPPGEMLVCLVGVANHDPAVFEQPERFDIRRASNPQLAFGGGVHYCVGAPLARLEAELAFEALLRRWPVLQLDEGAPRWRPMINLRGLESLRLRPGRSAAPLA